MVRRRGRGGRLGCAATAGRLSGLPRPLPPPLRRRSVSVVLMPVTPEPEPVAVRSGVTLFPEPSPRGPAWSGASSGTAPPRAIAANETALAAAKANLRPRQGERSASERPTSWIRKPPDLPGSTEACGPSGTYPKVWVRGSRACPDEGFSAPKTESAIRPPSKGPPGRRHLRGGGQPLEPREQPLGGRRRRGVREDVLQAALGIGLGLALGTGRQMGQHPVPYVMFQLTVDKRGKPVPQVLLRGGGT